MDKNTKTVTPIIIPKFSKIFDRLIEENKKGIVLEGSSRSGKTYNTAAIMIEICLVNKNWEHNVFKKELRDARNSVYIDYLKNLSENFRLKKGIHYKTDNTNCIITLCNGSVIKFFGTQDSDKLKGLACDSFHIDEVTECLKESFDQISLRSRCFGVLTYNPKYLKHWVYDTVLSNEGWLYLHSTFEDNPYLTKNNREAILAYDPSNEYNVKNGTADRVMWMVYGLGMRCGSEDRIFNNFVTYDVNNKPFTKEAYENPAKHFYCIDWGFANDEFALLEVRDLGSGEIVVETMIYEKGLHLYLDGDRDCLINRLKKMGFPKDKAIICDSATPQNINALVQFGYNARGTKKNTLKSIDIVKRFKKIYITQSDPLENETQTYEWAKKANGETISPPQPIDKNNHAIDALRYGLLEFYEIKPTDPNAVSIGRKYIEKQGRKAVTLSDRRNRNIRR